MQVVRLQLCVSLPKLSDAVEVEVRAREALCVQEAALQPRRSLSGVELSSDRLNLGLNRVLAGQKSNVWAVF